MIQTRRPRDRALPASYFAASHLFLAISMLAIAVRPDAMAGFFLHARLAAVVHGVTLGWLTLSILGALYMVWPVALGRELDVKWQDIWCCGLIVPAILGVVSHFWMQRYGGVGYSGCVILLVALLPIVRFLRALPAAKGPAPVRLHVAMGLGNFLLTVSLGILLAFNKDAPFLPATHLDSVFAHLHLGLGGWVGLMIVGVGYRLLPMFLPAHAPEGKALWGTALLLESGMLGIALSFLFAKALVPLFGGVAVLGLALFGTRVAGMLRARVPAPAALQRPDIGMLHTFQALLYLILSLPLGLWLALSDEWRIGWGMAYGVFLLLGFAAQFVLGISMRLQPMFAWKEAWQRSGFKKLPTNPGAMPVRPLQWGVFALWTAGVPLLACSWANDQIGWMHVAGSLLTGAALLALTHSALVLRHLFGRDRQAV